MKLKALTVCYSSAAALALRMPIGEGIETVAVAQKPRLRIPGWIGVCAGGHRRPRSRSLGPVRAPTETLPEPEACNEQTSRLMGRIDWAEGSMKTLQIPGDLNALVTELKALRPRKRADEKREAEILIKLKEFAMQQPAMLRFNKDIVAMIEEATASRIDADKLRANHPEIAADCTTTSTYLKVKVC